MFTTLYLNAARRCEGWGSFLELNLYVIAPLSVMRHDCADVDIAFLSRQTSPAHWRAYQARDSTERVTRPPRGLRLVSPITNITQYCRLLYAGDTTKSFLICANLDDAIRHHNSRISVTTFRTVMVHVHGHLTVSCEIDSCKDIGAADN